MVTNIFNLKFACEAHLYFFWYESLFIFISIFAFLANVFTYKYLSVW